MQLNLNFDQYVPVQHQFTEEYFAFLAIENKDFDSSSDSDTYLCYPVRRNGTVDTKVQYNFPKKDLLPIFLLV